MIQVPSLKILHHHDGAIWLQTGADELHNIPIMTTLQDGNFLLEHV